VLGPLLALAGCHAPEIDFTGDPREVASAHLRITTDLAPRDASRAQAWLERSLADMCERWALPLPEADSPLACYLFADPADFARFRDYDGVLRGGHAKQSGTCLGFYCAGCDAFATSPAVARSAPTLEDPSTWRPLEHVLAHELNHHLLDRNGARGSPSWLSEGAAEIEGLRAWAAQDRRRPARRATPPSQLYRALSLTSLALRGLYGERVLLDHSDRALGAVTWGQVYALDLAACLALEDLDPRLLRALATGAPLPPTWTPVRLDRLVREHALLLASEDLLRLARADRRAWPAVSALLAALWDAPLLASPTAPGVEAAWASRLGVARAQLRAGRRLGIRLTLAERPGDLRAGLAGSRRAVWLFAEAAARLAPGALTTAALGDLELWLLGDLERRALFSLSRGS
jgi:hypothetical protein